MGPEELERPLAALRHRGPDGIGIVCRGEVALGHLRSWTVPEEVGERQPISWGAVDVVFDGRLDDRPGLLRALGLGPEGRDLSDAALVLRAYARWGTACFVRLLGPFAVALADRRTGRVVCARDPLGDRPLFYRLDGRRLAAASEESALLALPGVAAELEEETLARFFAVEPPAPGATFFAGVRELPPACFLVVERDRQRLSRYWQADPEPRLRYRREEEYAEHFREVLGEAVRCRLRSVAPPAVLMSGGLDSTSVAALAASQGGLSRTVSYVFDELAACDERPYMDAVVARFGLEALRVPGDDAWPLRDLATWPRNPNTPVEGPYRRLRERVYAAARASGTGVLLTGEFGDELYSGGEHWLADLLREGRPVAAAGRLAAQLWHHGVRRLPTWHSTRAAVGCAVRQLAPARRERVAGCAAPSWLTPRAAALREEGVADPPSAARARRASQHRALLDSSAAASSAIESWHASQAGIEMRRPYRDRRLVELALSLPAHQLYRPGSTKNILRRAMAGLLPEPVRRRRRPTSLVPLFARGLAEREAETVRTLLADPGAVWPGYVRAEWLWPRLQAGFRREADGVEMVVPWQCLAAELWRQAGVAPASPAGVSWKEVLA